MLRLLSTIVGHPVVAQRDGRPIATVREAIGDASSGKLIAYRTTNGYVATADILGYTDAAVVVSDAGVLQAPGELIRVERLGDQRTPFLGSRVKSERGARLGTVTDVLLDTAGSHAARFHVRAPWWRRLTTPDRIIPREQVVRMTKDELVVRYDEPAPTSRGVEPEVA